ncbi:MAG: 7-cyano-7-deazaguanine synthase [Candidatus Aminicenantia bacterium]
MEEIKNEVAVMFSGGIDSLLTAVLLQEKFDKVHLITFDKGYLEFGLENNKSNIERLKKIYGDEKYINKIIDIKKILKNVSIKTILKDYKYYGIEVVWCVACRLSMNTGALIYALENNLSGIADGSSREQVPGEEQLVGTAENFPKVVNRLKEFVSQYYVDFLTPVYEFGTREERRKKLRKLGFEIDYLSLDRGKGIKGMMTKDVFFRTQPMCFSGWLIHWKRNLFGIPVKQDEDKTLEYVAKKQESVIKNLIKEYFKQKNVDIENLIQKRKNLKELPKSTF